MKKNKTLMCIDPVTGNNIEAVSMVNKFSDKIIENMFSGTINTGKLVSDCINEYCVLKVNGKELVSKEILYNKGKTVITGDNIYLDKTCKTIPVSVQYNLSNAMLQQQNEINDIYDKARIIEHDTVNDRIKIALHMTDGRAAMITLNGANKLCKDFE